MKSKKELIQEYKNRKKPAGIYQIKNLKNNKVLLGSSLDLDGPLNSHRFRLELGRHPNQALQKDWNEFGAEAFIFEVLEVIEQSDDPEFKVSDELGLLEERWLEKKLPLYNTDNNLHKL